jgi:acyl-CoA thioesterase I
VFLRAFLVVFLLTALAACDGKGGESPPEDRRAPAPAAAVPAPAPAPAPERDATPRIIVLGDSLTAGLGLDVTDSFPAVIQKRLDESGIRYKVVNAGVSGDTSAGGLRRLEWALGEGNPRILIVALGGNDGLRGLPASELTQNLASIIEQGQKRGLTVILAGMEAPPNYGPEYTAAFRATYPELARQYHVTLIPFLLAGVAGDAALNQSDGIHPNARGARVVADLVWTALQPALAKDQTTR